MYREKDDSFQKTVVKFVCLLFVLSIKANKKWIQNNIEKTDILIHNSVLLRKRLIEVGADNFRI